jgi:organic radical activating enzyme
LYSLNYIEVYITHECNLTCSNCNRLNNYEFKGHLTFENSKEKLTKWAGRINFANICIIGGEPTLNPDLLNWNKGLRELWPAASINIQSNGTNFSDYWNPHNVGISVAPHLQQSFTPMTAKWGKQAIINEGILFSKSVIKSNNEQYSVWDSDPNVAFQCCTMKNSPTIFNGDLFKCPTAATLPEFRKQFSLTVTEKQDELINSFSGLSSECSDVELESFISSQSGFIRQCALCPSDGVFEPVKFDLELLKKKSRQ